MAHVIGIGELARRSGVTVRALRHYDEIGLLAPSERTVSGHRRYTPDDVRRLYRIRALRSLGLSLDEIARVLASSEGDLRAVLTAQVTALDQQARQLAALRERVGGLLARLGGTGPDPAEFLRVLEMIAVYEKYFTEDQRTALASRRAELGSDGVEAARAEWAELVPLLLEHVSAGTPVEDPSVQELVRRWDAIAARMGGTDDRTAAAARTMWRENTDELSARLPWSAADLAALVDYVTRARSTP